MTKTFKFLLGLSVVVFIVLFIISIIGYFQDGNLSGGMKWADLITFILCIILIPCISLSEVRDRRLKRKQSVKRWTVENKVWSNNQEKK